jgi:hypothetical protein
MPSALVVVQHRQVARQRRRKDGVISLWLEIMASISCLLLKLWHGTMSKHVSSWALGEP